MPIVAVAIYGLCRKSTVRDKKQRRTMLDEKDRRSGGQRKHDEGWNDTEGKKHRQVIHISHKCKSDHFEKAWLFC